MKDLVRIELWLFLLFIVFSLCMDMNGRFLCGTVQFSEGLTMAIFFGLWLAGMIFGIRAFFTKQHRLSNAVFLFFYVLMILPMVLPL